MELDQGSEREPPVRTRRTGQSAKRTPIPDAVRRAVLAEAAYQCANPRCTHVLTLQLHHMIWVKDGGANEPSNLVALCGWHHDLHTQGHIPAEAIRMWKGMLLALNHAFDRESMDLLLFLYRQRRQRVLRVTGDGALTFARLIARGLVELGSTAVNRTPGPNAGPAISTHEPALTEAGLLLVEAWLNGDESGYAQMLNEPPRNSIS